jgi:hypothetical protein
MMVPVIYNAAIEFSGREIVTFNDAEKAKN